jgi:hypothetical protein
MKKAEEELLVEREARKVLRRFGARIARFLPLEGYETVIELRIDSFDARAKTLRVLQAQTIGGQIDGASDGDSGPISAVVGSGYLNLNPTFIQVRVSATSSDCSSLTIKGFAREGLIKQKSARTAVDRISKLLGHTF